MDREINRRVIDMVQLYAVISETSPRYQDWVYILGSNQAPIMSSRPVPGLTSTPSAGELFYKMDLLRITEEQRERLIKLISDKWNLGCAAVERQLVDPARGIAIPVDDVLIVLDDRMRH